MREILRPGIALFIVTLVSSISLGIVHNITAAPIERQRILTRDSALQELLPQAESFEETESIPGNADITNYFTGTLDGQTIGHVIGTSPPGYSGDIEMLIAIDTEGIVAGVKIVKQTETPGLGAHAQSPEFLDQFTNKPGLFTVTKSVAKNENDIEVITSSTITTDAVVYGVNKALDFWYSDIKQGGQ